MKRVILTIIIMCLFGCYGGTKVLNFKTYENTKPFTSRFCYKFSPSLPNTGKIHSITYLEKKDKLASFHYSYTLENVLKKIILARESCKNNNAIMINEINIFRKSVSDTAQWKKYFFIEVNVDYEKDGFLLKNVNFKDFDNTGWVYVFKFHKPENEIITETIQRALIRIFTDIEDAITNKLTLEQRNAKKTKERLETEKLMDKYIKLQKALE